MDRDLPGEKGRPGLHLGRDDRGGGQSLQTERLQPPAKVESVFPSYLIAVKKRTAIQIEASYFFLS